MKSNRNRELPAPNTRRLKKFTTNQISKKMNPRKTRILKVIPIKINQLNEKRLIDLNHDHVTENPSIEVLVTPSTREDIPADTTENTPMKKEIIIHQDTAQMTDIMMTDIGTIAMKRRTGKKGMAKRKKRNHYFTNHEWSNHL